MDCELVIKVSLDLFTLGQEKIQGGGAFTDAIERRMDEADADPDAYEDDDEVAEEEGRVLGEGWGRDNEVNEGENLFDEMEAWLRGDAFNNSDNSGEEYSDNDGGL